MSERWSTDCDGVQRSGYQVWLQGYCAALADMHRASGNGAQVYQIVVDGGINYHDFKDAGAEAYDLGEIAKARDAWKAAPAQVTSPPNHALSGPSAPAPKPGKSP